MSPSSEPTADRAESLDVVAQLEMDADALPHLRWERGADDLDTFRRAAVPVDPDGTTAVLLAYDHDPDRSVLVLLPTDADASRLEDVLTVIGAQAEHVREPVAAPPEPRGLVANLQQTVASNSGNSTI